jgi:hypothetical protein
VFVTADRNLPNQQRLANLDLGVVVLAAGSTKLQDLRALIDELSEALRTVQPGSAVRVPSA